MRSVVVVVFALVAACVAPPIPFPVEGEGEGEGEPEPFRGWWYELPSRSVVAEGRVGESLMVVASGVVGDCAVTTVALDFSTVDERTFLAPCSRASVSDAGAFLVIEGSASIEVDAGTVVVGEGSFGLVHVEPSGAASAAVVPLAAVSLFAAMADGTTVAAASYGQLHVLGVDGTELRTISITGTANVRLGPGDTGVVAVIDPVRESEVELADGSFAMLFEPTLAMIDGSTLGLRLVRPFPSDMHAVSLRASLRNGDISLCGGRPDTNAGVAVLVDGSNGEILREAAAPTWLGACSIAREGEIWGASSGEIYRMTAPELSLSVPVVAAQSPAIHHLSRAGDDLLVVIDAPAKADLARPLPEGRLTGRAGELTSMVLRAPVAQLVPIEEPTPEPPSVEAFAADGSSWIATFDPFAISMDVDPLSGDVVSARRDGLAGTFWIERRAADGAQRWRIGIDATTGYLGQVEVVTRDAFTVAAVAGSTNMTVAVDQVTFSVPDAQTLVFVVDDAGQVTASAVVEGVAHAMSVASGITSLLTRGEGGTVAVTRHAPDLSVLSSTTLALRGAGVGANRPEASHVAVLPDGDTVAVLSSELFGPVTFDDDSTRPAISEIIAGALLRADASGRLRWLITLPNIAHVSDFAHVRGASLSPDGTRLAACGLTAGGAITDERSLVQLASLADRQGGAYCLEVDATSGALLALLDLQEPSNTLSGVMYLGSDAVALLSPPAGQGSRLVRLRDGARSPELFLGGVQPWGSVGSVGDAITIAIDTAARTDFSPLVAGFEAPGLAGQFVLALVHFDRAVIGF